MRSLIFAVLLLSVVSGGVMGNARCFLEKIADCGKQFGQKAALQMPDMLLCKYREQLFACVHESEKECSVDKRYNFDDAEAMYNEVCTDGTPLNEKMKEYNDCLMSVFSKELSCVQDIIDFVKQFKELTPEVLFKLEQLTCKERKDINNCYTEFAEKICGADAKDFFVTISKASDKVNENICEDILKEEDSGKI